MKIRVEPEAEIEILEATRYLATKSAVAADNFLDDIIEARTRLLQFPRSGPPIGKTARRFLLRRFSYQLIYRVTDDEIVIYAVAHCKRRPRYWNKRLKR